MEEKIKIIHDSSLFGIFIETGQAAVISNALMKVPGSSRTIYSCEVPYHKKSQDKYHKEKVRSVSMEAVSNFINYHRNDKESLDAGVNFIFATSFQIGNYNDKSTHGWFGIFDYQTEESIFWHVSIHESLSREEYLNEIARIGIELLGRKFISGKNVPHDCYIDDIRSFKNGLVEKDLKEKLIESCSKSLPEKMPMLCFEKGEAVRMEDLFRDKPIIIYKGSFNPVHNVHYDYAKVIEEKHGKPVFAISINTFQKGHTSSEDLMKRIYDINSLGFPVIILNSVYFHESVSIVRNKFNQEITFMVGSDTFNRIIETTHQTPEAFEKDFTNVKFYVIKRSGYPISERVVDFERWIIVLDMHKDSYISSTQIRKLKEEMNFEEIKKLVPSQIYDHITKDLKVEKS